jgi:diacylglycerol O-acyltransferase
VTAALADPAWGQEQSMSPLETIMWRVESDGILKSTMVALEILEHAPVWADVTAAHRRALDTIPRLRHRVVETPFGVSAPRWSPDAQFDLHFHLRRSRLPEGAQWQDLFSAVEQIAMSPFDRSRPPWEAVLFEGLPDGRAAYVLKLHHASTDGLGTMQLMAQLHSSVPATASDPPPGTEPRAEPVRASPSAVAVLAGGALGTARAAPAGVRLVGRLARRFADAPLPAVRTGIRYAESLLRVLTPPAAEPSPLLEERSTNWRLAAIDVNLVALKDAAQAAGGSLNDAYLAALLGGYRRYHEALGSPVESIPMAIPISVRREGDPAGGNRFATARLSGPVGLTDPAERIRVIHAMVAAARLEPALDNIRVLAPVLAKLPVSMIAQVAGGMTRGNDLQASNVPGAREDVYLAGVRVERLYPYAPLPGCPAMITLVSHGDTCCVGVNYDSASFTDGALFLSSLEAGFTEVLALASADEGAARWLR